MTKVVLLCPIDCFCYVGEGYHVPYENIVKCGEDFLRFQFMSGTGFCDILSGSPQC